MHIKDKDNGVKDGNNVKDEKAKSNPDVEHNPPSSNAKENLKNEPRSDESGKHKRIASTTSVIKKIKLAGRYNYEETGLGENVIGKTIRVQRKLKNLTQKQLADLLGCSQSTVNQWELGKYIPSTEVSRVLCDILRIDANYYFGLSDVNERAFTLSSISAQVRKMISRFNMLDKEGQSIVVDLLDLLHARSPTVF